MKFSTSACAAVIALSWAAQGAQADTVIYDDPAAFLAAVDPGGYLEDFSSYSPGQLPEIITLGPVEGFSYDMFGTGGMFAGDGIMSTFVAGVDLPMEITFTGDPVTAISANFWLTDIDFFNQAGTLTITVTSDMETIHSLVDPTESTFLAFISEAPITLISLQPLLDQGTAWPTVDNLFVGTGVTIADADLDGVADDADNCITLANPSQRDSNVDGFGNRCDADLNNDCSVNFLDLAVMKSVFFSDDADADLDGDGSVNFMDLGVMKAMFFMPPGPSGVPNNCDGS